MNNLLAGTDERPWYREVWPWMLMLPPALAVAGGITMLVLATHTSSALVVDDYARIEELTNERFERDGEALRLGLTAELRFEPANGRVELELSGNDEFESPEALILFFRHPTDPAADFELSLSRDGGIFVTDAEFEPGSFYVELMPENGAWRLGSGVHRLEGQLALNPQTDGD